MTARKSVSSKIIEGKIKLIWLDLIVLGSQHILIILCKSKSLNIFWGSSWSVCLSVCLDCKFNLEASNNQNLQLAVKTGYFNTWCSELLTIGIVNCKITNLFLTAEDLNSKKILNKINNNAFPTGLKMIIYTKASTREEADKHSALRWLTLTWNQSRHQIIYIYIPPNNCN